MRDSLLATCTLSSSGMGPFTATAHETTNLGRHRRAEHVSRKREISIGPKQARRAHGGAPDRGASRGGAAVSPTSPAEPRRGERREALYKRRRGCPAATHAFLGLLAIYFLLFFIQRLKFNHWVFDPN